MRRILAIALVGVACHAPAVRATDLIVTIEAEACDASTITVGPGCTVFYRVIGELSDNASAGLAVVVLDLEFDGGPLPQADEPTEFPMLNFVAPNGFSGNPEGYGGTARPGKLVQVGGAQNVFNHGSWQCDDFEDCPRPSFCNAGICTNLAGLPIGTLIMDVAAPGSPVVLTSGTVTAPSSEGTYTLEIPKLAANLVRQDATGDPIWATEAAGVGPITNLSITVRDAAPCCGEPGVACCLSNGSCEFADPDGCVNALGGVPGPAGSVCEGDGDNDGIDGECGDSCPDDPDKFVPGLCGCGVSDADSDGDTIPDCSDQCPGQDDRVDNNDNGVPDCLEQAPIPALSEWGLVILALLLLTTGRQWFGHRFRMASKIQQQ